MLLRTLSLLMIVMMLTPLCHAQEAPVKAAFMYSGWPEGTAAFKNEFDKVFAALGWQATTFENKQAKELSDRLGEFTIVVGSGVSNLANPQDFTPYAPRWQAFLENGGVVVATDASYGPINDGWIGKINPEFATSSATCSAHTKPSAETAVVKLADEAPLLTVPHDIRAGLRAKGSWAHLENVGAGWTVAATCYDDKPLMVYRPVGKGFLVLTSFFRFSGEEQLGKGLLENALTMARLQQQGLQLTKLEGQEQRLKGNRVIAGLKNVSAEPATVSVRMNLALGEAKVVGSRTATIPAGASADLPIDYDLPARGQWTGTLELLKGDQVALTSKHEVAVPELIALRLNTKHQYVQRPTLKPQVTLAPELRERLGKLSVRLALAGSKPVALKPTELQSQAQLSLASLKPGDYALTAVLLDGQKELARAEAPLVLHPQPRVTYDERNICLVDGNPFFPLGMYQVAWAKTKDEKIACVRELAAAGFNCAHISCTDLDDFQAVLDEAQGLGFKLLIEGLGAEMAPLHRFKDHPAVLGWNSGDEPDCSNTPPEQVGTTIEAIRDADWGHVIYTTVANPEALIRYAPYADVFSNDPYPLAQQNINTMAVARQTERARDSVAGQKPLWMVPQCFGYVDGPWQVPTPAQERSMTYQTLIEGAQGLIWYTFDDTKFKVLEHPELWAMMKQLVSEIKTLTPVLLHPALDAKRFTAGPEACIRAAAIPQGKELTIMAAHTNDQDLGAQELTIPGLKGKLTAEVMFEGRSVQVQDGKLNDSFAPYAVHVYRVKQ